MVAKPTSIKSTGGKSGGYGWKAIELTPGDLLLAMRNPLNRRMLTRTSLVAWQG
jgi:hypothetical protein